MSSHSQSCADPTSVWMLTDVGPSKVFSCSHDCVLSSKSDPYDNNYKVHRSQVFGPCFKAMFRTVSTNMLAAKPTIVWTSNLAWVPVLLTILSTRLSDGSEGGQSAVTGP